MLKALVITPPGELIYKFIFLIIVIFANATTIQPLSAIINVSNFITDGILRQSCNNTYL